MDIVMSTNPGSYLRLDYNHQSGRFKRFFVAFNASIQGFRHYRPLLPITFIFDRNAGLLEALPKILPTAYHYFCLQHLKANLRDRFSGPSFSNTFRSRIVFLFSSCAYAPTVGCFN
ncbi:hypothetical protein ACSBR1_019312 [Camellia fascicularis]